MKKHIIERYASKSVAKLILAPIRYLHSDYDWFKQGPPLQIFRSGGESIKEEEVLISVNLKPLNLKSYFDDEEYGNSIGDLIAHEAVCSMENYIQHSNISCLQHSLHVSYTSYLICKRLGLDFRSAARGGLLHDFFLYDWHGTKPYRGLHGFIHPRIALRNANKYFYLNEMEKEIIIKHMWPLTLSFPKYKEAYVVVLADKYCAFMEIFMLGGKSL